MAVYKDDLQVDIQTTSSGNGGQKAAQDLNHIAKAADNVTNAQQRNVAATEDMSSETRKASNNLSKLASGISLIDPIIGGYTQGVARAVTATSSLADIGKTVSTIFKSLWDALVKNPIMWIVALVGGLVYTLKSLIDIQEEARKKALEYATSVEEIIRLSKDQTEMIDVVNKFISKQAEAYDKAKQAADNYAKAQHNVIKAQHELQKQQLKNEMEAKLKNAPLSERESIKAQYAIKTARVDDDMAIESARETERQTVSDLKRITQEVENTRANIKELESAFKSEQSKTRTVSGTDSSGSVWSYSVSDVDEDKIQEIRNKIRELTNKLNDDVKMRDELAKLASIQQQIVSEAIKNAEENKKADIETLTYKQMLRASSENLTKLQQELVDNAEKMSDEDKINHKLKIAIQKAQQEYYKAILNGTKEEEARQAQLNAIKSANDEADKERIKLNQSRQLARYQNEDVRLTNEYLKKKQQNNGKISKEDEAEYNRKKAYNRADKEYFQNLNSGMETDTAQIIYENAKLQADLAYDEAMKAKSFEPQAFKQFDSNYIQQMGGYASKTSMTRSGVYVTPEKQMLELAKKDKETQTVIKDKVIEINNAIQSGNLGSSSWQ